MSALFAAVGGIGYVQAGYVVALGVLALYATSLVLRRRALLRRLPPSEAAPVAPREPAGEEGPS
jgi:heme exporter protein D